MTKTDIGYSTLYNFYGVSSSSGEVEASTLKAVEIDLATKGLKKLAAQLAEHMQPQKVIVKCGHCGQWGAAMTACRHCGSPIDPE